MSSASSTIPPTTDKASSKSKKSRRSSKSSQASSGGRSGADQAKTIQRAYEKLSKQLGWSEITERLKNFKPQSTFDNWYAINKLRDTVSKTIGSDAIPGWLASEDTTGLTGHESEVDTGFKSWVDDLGSTVVKHEPMISAYAKGPLKGILTKKVKRALEKDTRLRGASSLPLTSAPSQPERSRSRRSKNRTTEKTIDPTTNKGTARKAELDKQHRGKQRSSSNSGSTVGDTKTSKRSSTKSRGTSASTADKARKRRGQRSSTAATSPDSTILPSSSAGPAGQTTQGPAQNLTSDQIKARMGAGYGMPPSTNATIEPTAGRATSLGNGRLTQDQIQKLTGAQISEMVDGATPAIDRIVRQNLTPEQISKAESSGPVDAGTMASKLTSMFTAKHFKTLGSEIANRTPRFYMENGKLVEERTIQSVGKDGTGYVLTRKRYNNGEWTEKSDVYVPQGSAGPPSWATGALATSAYPVTQATQGGGKPGWLVRLLGTTPSSAPQTTATPNMSPLLNPASTLRPQITSPFSAPSHTPSQFSTPFTNGINSYMGGHPFMSTGQFTGPSTGQTYARPATGLATSDMRFGYPSSMANSPIGIGAGGTGSMPSVFGMA